MHNARLANLRNALKTLKLESILISDLYNIFYLSGFTGSAALLLVTENSCQIVVDPRYTVQAGEQCKAATVIEYFGKPTVVAISELINDLKPLSVGIEADCTNLVEYRHLRKYINKTISIKSTSDIVHKLRLIKDSHEIELIKKAANLTDAALAEVIPQIKPGVSEKDVALLIDYTVRKLGGDKEAFETIAAAGPHAACPHAEPTDYIISNGDMLKMDFGTRYKYYNADITRTIFIGDETDKFKKIYKIVLDAQLKAIEAIKPGKSGREIDRIARDYIASNGYGDNFGHGLGHGLGIEVHDSPAFSKTSSLILQPGMVLTVEPGIYIEGWGGIRIEDDVYVLEDGVEIITTSPK